MKPLVQLCKACGEIAIEHDGRAARPRVTCSPECNRTWATARVRASRAKLKAVRHLEQAIKALTELQPNRPADRLCQVLEELEELKPGDLAMPPQQARLTFVPVPPGLELRR